MGRTKPVSKRLPLRTKPQSAFLKSARPNASLSCRASSSTSSAKISYAHCPGYLFALSFPTDQPDPRVRLPDSVPAAGSLRFSPKRHLAPAFRYALHAYSENLRIRGAHAPGPNRKRSEERREGQEGGRP